MVTCVVALRSAPRSAVRSRHSYARQASDFALCSARAHARTHALGTAAKVRPLDDAPRRRAPRRHHLVSFRLGDRRDFRQDRRERVSYFVVGEIARAVAVCCDSAFRFLRVPRVHQLAVAGPSRTSRATAIGTEEESRPASDDETPWVGGERSVAVRTWGRGGRP